MPRRLAWLMLGYISRSGFLPVAGGCLSALNERILSIISGYFVETRKNLVAQKHHR